MALAKRNYRTDPLEDLESDEEFLARFSHDETELREAIAHLIRRRELLRDCEIEMLEDQCEKLMERITKAKQRILLEELECFKEVLRLHKRLLKHDQS